jgi:lipoate---protein ligase
MNLLDLTLNTAAENLALDEALLERADQSEQPAEVLRLWEPRSLMVVLGSSSRAADEVKLDECRQGSVPVLRRPSGGATIVTGPGCLMYAVVLSCELRPNLRSIERAHRFVLDTIAEPLQKKLIELDIHRAGTSDLAISERKFSGNSLRCKRTHLLYHGTLLYKFPIDQIEKLLGMPSRQPDYRVGRRHGDFVTNLPLPARTLRESLIQAFQADDKLTDWPRELTAKLVTEKYSRDDWNFRL